MIKKLSIYNFQSHEESHLEFHDGVNIIVGSSDSGKSAVIRALRWLVYGKPRGEGFCSWWGGETRVEVETESHTIIRTKEKDRNEYQLISHDGKKLTFNAFGNDVPEEVLKALNMDDINLQRQGDSPFLISNTPGEVAQHFNRMAQLERIDLGLKNISSSIRETSQKKKFTEQEYQRKKQELSEYKYLDKLETEVGELETLYEKKKSIYLEKESLVNIIYNLRNIEKKEERFSHILPAENLLSDISTQLDKKNTGELSKQALSQILSSLEILTRKISRGEGMIKAEELLNEIIEKSEQADEKELKYKKLFRVKKEIKSVDELIRSQEEQNTRDTDLYEENMPDVCPFCNSTTTHKH